MPSRNQAAGQDWEPQVYHVHKTGGGNEHPKKMGEQATNRALQSGQQVDIQRREHQKMNQQSASAGANAKKLDEDHESLKVKKVDGQLRIRIQKARQELNWTQQDLAQQISERVGVVTEYENGKAVPEERIIIKMEKAFGMHLRGAMAGQPMGKHRPTPKPKEQ